MLNETDYSQLLDKKEEKKDQIVSNPWDVIVATAEGLGIKLNQPNPHCKRCNGRGYVGVYADTKQPIACRCIFRKEDLPKDDGFTRKPINRAERRKVARGK